MRAVRGTSGTSAGLLPLPMIRSTPLPAFDYRARTAQAASFAFIRCDRLGRERQEPGIRIQGGHGMPPSGWGGPANAERNPLAPS